MIRGQEHPLKVVCVDDDERDAAMIARYLRNIACTSRAFTDSEECLRHISANHTDIVIADLNMPGMDGFQLLKKIKTINPACDVIIATGAGNKENAIQALRFGAADFLEKPVALHDFTAAIERTVRYRTVVKQRDEAESRVSYFSEQQAKKWGIERIIGKSKAIQSLIEDIRSIQKSDLTSVLITGESGTGKELVAHAIHAGSARRLQPFVPVNCSAIPESLAESVLFGHIKGSFTGASDNKKGAFELADGGTLFLDEVGDMIPAIQAKFLRVLEDGVVDPVGSTKGKHVNVRVIAATNCDLDTRVEAGRFREDLFHRLARFRITLVPLRERKEDIPVLAAHLAERLAMEMGIAVPAISSEVVAELQKHDYPGNVRELRNLLERALIRSGGCIELRQVSPASHGAERTTVARKSAAPAQGDIQAAPELPMNLAEVEKLTVRRALQKTDGNVTEAARILGISRTKVYQLSKAI